MSDPVHDLARLLSEARHAVVLTGAGISTESGIPDFRSPGGLWEKYDPMVVGSMSTFMNDPAQFWEFHRPRFEVVDSVEPNAAHIAVAELERRGIVRAVITQNIDGLHRRAGTEDPIEIHGSLSGGRCLRCDHHVSRDELLARADAADDGVPRCNCGFQLKSHVVLFGEMLPSAALDATLHHATTADMLLVIGSSLLVSPVSDIPGMVLSNGGRIAILTEGDTPYDHRADVRIRSKAAETMPRVIEELDRMGGPSTDT